MAENESALISRWQQINQRIQELAELHPAAEPRKLLAVSKYAEDEAVRILYRAGQYDFAENYLQAALKKMAALNGLSIIWHFIGQLQANKCATIAQNFSWVHSLAAVKHAELLAHARQGNPALQICLQVNFSPDQEKYGVVPQDLPQLIEAVLNLPTLCLRGLMVLPKPGVVDDFAKLAELRDRMAAQFQISLPTLSMGMSADYTTAIAAGATILRVGSALFHH
jgi:hypothetical protein